VQEKSSVESCASSTSIYQTMLDILTSYHNVKVCCIVQRV